VKKKYKKKTTKRSDQGVKLKVKRGEIRRDGGRSVEASREREGEKETPRNKTLGEIQR